MKIQTRGKTKQKQRDKFNGKYYRNKVFKQTIERIVREYMNLNTFSSNVKDSSEFSFCDRKC